METAQISPSESRKFHRNLCWKSLILLQYKEAIVTSPITSQRMRNGGQKLYRVLVKISLKRLRNNTGAKIRFCYRLEENLYILLNHSGFTL